MENEIKKQRNLKEAIEKYQKFIGNVRQKKMLFSGLVNTFVENYKRESIKPSLLKK